MYTKAGRRIKPPFAAVERPFGGHDTLGGRRIIRSFAGCYSSSTMESGASLGDRCGCVEAFVLHDNDRSRCLTLARPDAVQTSPRPIKAFRPVAPRTRDRSTIDLHLPGRSSRPRATDDLLVPEKHFSDKQNRTVGNGLTSSAIRSYGPLLTFGWCGRETRVSPSGFREPDWAVRHPPIAGRLE